MRGPDGLRVRRPRDDGQAARSPAASRERLERRTRRRADLAVPRPAASRVPRGARRPPATPSRVTRLRRRVARSARRPLGRLRRRPQRPRRPGRDHGAPVAGRRARAARASSRPHEALPVPRPAASSSVLYAREDLARSRAYQLNLNTGSRMERRPVSFDAGGGAARSGSLLDLAIARASTTGSRSPASRERRRAARTLPRGAGRWRRSVRTALALVARSDGARRRPDRARGPARSWDVGDRRRAGVSQAARRPRWAARAPRRPVAPRRPARSPTATTPSRAAPDRGRAATRSSASRCAAA